MLRHYKPQTKIRTSFNGATVRILHQCVCSKPETHLRLRHARQRPGQTYKKFDTPAAIQYARDPWHLRGGHPSLACTRGRIGATCTEEAKQSGSIISTLEASGAKPAKMVKASCVHPHENSRTNIFYSNSKCLTLMFRTYVTDTSTTSRGRRRSRPRSNKIISSFPHKLYAHFISKRSIPQHHS